MKNVRDIPAAILTLDTFAWKDNTGIQAEPKEEFVSVRMNGLAWAGVPEVHLNKHTGTLTFLGIASYPTGEVIVLKLKFEGVGTYSLTRNQAYYYTTVGGDVPTSAYKLSPVSAGVLRICRYDAAEKLMEGSFRLTLTKERSNPEDTVETMSLTDGKFLGTVTG